MSNEVIYRAHVFDCECKDEVREYAERVNELVPEIDYRNIVLSGSTGNFFLYIPLEKEQEFLEKFNITRGDTHSGILSVSIIKF